MWEMTLSNHLSRLGFGLTRIRRMHTMPAEAGEPVLGRQRKYFRSLRRSRWPISSDGGRGAVQIIAVQSGPVDVIVPPLRATKVAP